MSSGRSENMKPFPWHLCRKVGSRACECYYEGFGDGLRASKRKQPTGMAALGGFIGGIFGGLLGGALSSGPDEPEVDAPEEDVKRGLDP